jgi:hypothetical protein
MYVLRFVGNDPAGKKRAEGILKMIGVFIRVIVFIRTIFEVVTFMD